MRLNSNDYHENLYEFMTHMKTIVCQFIIFHGESLFLSILRGHHFGHWGLGVELEDLVAYLNVIDNLTLAVNQVPLSGTLTSAIIAAALLAVGLRGRRRK